MTISSRSPLTNIEAAAAVLRSGGLVALPTDTLYALSALASDAMAVQRVFDLKGREAAKALPLFVSGAAMAERIAVLDGRARRLAARFWPGQLTIVVRKLPSFDSLALGGGETVALRSPDHPLALELLRALGEPITATSANRSGRPDPVTAADVSHQLGDAVDLIIDGGACRGGVSSTIVDCSGTEVVVLRAGAVAEAAVRAALAEPASAAGR